MSRKILALLPRDPDALVFLLTSTLYALYILLVPGSIVAL